MKKLIMLVVMYFTTQYLIAQDLKIVISNSFGGKPLENVCCESPTHHSAYKMLITGAKAGDFELVASTRYTITQEFRSKTAVGYNIVFRGQNFLFQSFKFQKINQSNSVVSIPITPNIRYTNPCLP
jgi:uncharacterized membrane protein